MSIATDYFTLLDHLGPTKPVRDLLGEAADIVTLRHDVDHDLDLALEMAFWEQREGRQASYFLLPTAAYWDDPLFLDKVRQLDDYGHEVGLHLNVLAEWASGDIDDVDARVREQLDRLRGAGVDVVGVAAHGDRRCYTHGVINSWCLSELRPEEPALSQSGLSAEGVPSPDPAFRIAYPGDVIARPDGARFPLWSVSMADHGIAYEAVGLDYAGYFSDSGGGWTRTPDPGGVDLSRGRHQVLVHPVHWRGAPRVVFALSTARSGSKWLTAALERASSARAVHEFTLNHRLGSKGDLIPDKRTAAGFTHLVQAPGEVRELMIQARAAFEDHGVDQVEANVYLPHLLEQVGEVFPEAVLVHLHREPRAVVQSLLNRDWYDTPEDDHHVPVPVDGWLAMSQLEKCCWYVRHVSETLLDRCDIRIPLEAATADPDVLVEAMASAGIAFHRRLIGDLLELRIDATTDPWVPTDATWPEEDRAAAALILRPVAERLGYVSGKPHAQGPPQGGVTRRPPAQALHSVVVAGPEVPERASHVGCKVAEHGRDVLVTPERDRHGHLLLGGGRWRLGGPQDGWPVNIGAFTRVTVESAFEPDGVVTLFGLTYTASGELLAARRVARLRPGTTVGAFRPRADGARWNVALHFPQGAAPPRVAVSSAKVEQVEPIRQAPTERRTPPSPHSGQGNPAYPTPAAALAATDEFYSREGFAYTEEMVVSWLRRHVELPKTGRVLDLCSGDGIWSRGIAVINPELELFGIDISDGAIRKARSLLAADERHFVTGDAETSLPWEEGFFDLVFARGPGLYNQHSMDRQATIEVIERWHRLLAPQGRMWSIFASDPRRMGTYTPIAEVKLPFNRATRRTSSVDFRGGKYHHTIESFCTPFWKAEGVSVVRYSFIGNMHILVTARGD